MTGGGPVHASNTMAVYMVDWGFKRFQFGYASAVAVIMLVISLLIALTYQRFVLRRDIDGALTTMSQMKRARALRGGRRWSRRAILIPVVYAVLGGFRDTGQIGSDPVGLPIPWVFSNYGEILGSGTFWRQVCNSALIALVSTLLTVPLAALAAFVFARFAFPGREVLYARLHARAAVPGRGRDPADLHHGPQPRAARQPARRRAAPGRVRAADDDRDPAPVLRSFPNELQDAAAIDGCGPFRFFWRILLPLSRPVLATVAVLAIVGSWNAFLLPLVVLTEADNWTLPLGVTNYSTQYTADTARRSSPSRRCRWCRRSSSTRSPSATWCAG